MLEKHVTKYLKRARGKKTHLVPSENILLAALLQIWIRTDLLRYSTAILSGNLRRTHRITILISHGSMQTSEKHDWLQPNSGMKKMLPNRASVPPVNSTAETSGGTHGLLMHKFSFPPLSKGLTEANTKKANQIQSSFCLTLHPSAYQCFRGRK